MARKRTPKPIESLKPSPSVELETAPGSDLELASPVAAIVNLVEILVEECWAKRTPQGFEKIDDVQITLEQEAGEINVMKDKSLFNVRITNSVKVYKEEHPVESSEPCVSIRCSYVMVYSVPDFEGLASENFKAFAKTSGFFSLWPFWREYVYSTSLRLAVPPIVLPTYRN
jgi:hypothetical protein